MKKPKGPDMSLPKVKTPKFLADLVSDLRDRRLLPLVAVLVVAIVAVPIALSKSATQPQSAPDGSLLGSASTANASHLTAVPDAPGLRDYHRRLSHQHATDPFTPPASASPSQPESAATESSATASSSSASVPSSSESTPATAENGSTTSNETSVVHLETKYFSYDIDVRIVDTTPGADASAASRREPTVRRNLPTLTKLPWKKMPAAVYMGASSDGKRAILLISSNVQSVSGEGRCVLGSAGICQLLALKPGSPEEIVYGANGHTFRIQILKIHLVVTHRPD